MTFYSLAKQNWTKCFPLVYSITQDTGLYEEIGKKGAGGLMAFIREDLSGYRRRKLEPESVEALICLDVMDFRKSVLVTDPNKSISLQNL